MATITASSYNKIPVFGDAGNLIVSRLEHSQAAAIPAADTVLLGKLPAYALPSFLVLTVENIGAATLDISIGGVEVVADATANGLYPISGIDPSETGERDIVVAVDTGATGADFSLQLDIAYCVTQLGG